MAVLFLSGALQGRLNTAHFSAHEQQQIMAQAVNLGNAKAPADMSAADKTLVEKLYHSSFITAYGMILRIAAILAFTGALMAVIFIRNSGVKAEKGTGR